MKTNAQRGRSGRRRLSLGGGALVLLAALASARQQAAPSQGTVTSPNPTPLSSFVTGICAHFPAGTTATSTAEWSNIRRTGVSMVRVDASWSEIEVAGRPANDPYDWRRLDNLQSLAAAQGLRLLIILGYGNTRWSPSYFSPPLAGDAKDHWDAFVSAAAARYGDAWFEVWNEPDIYGTDPTTGAAKVGFWDPAPPSPSDYVKLLLDTAAAIRQGRPGAHVMMGGVAYTGPRNGPNYPYDQNVSIPWLQAVLGDSRVPLNVVDSVAFHPYVGAVDPGLSYEAARNFRAVLTRFGGASKPMYATELGAREDWIQPVMDADAYVLDADSPGYIAGSTASPSMSPNLVRLSKTPGAGLPSSTSTWLSLNGSQKITGDAPDSSVPTVTTSTVASPVPGATAMHVVPGTGAGYSSGLVSRNGSEAVSTYYTVSAYLRSDTPQVLHIGAQTDTPILVNQTWKRFSVTVKTTSDPTAKRVFVVYGPAGGPAWDIAAPMAIYSPGQGTESGGVRDANRQSYEASFATKRRQMIPGVAKKFMQAMYDAGAAGAFYFSWRDLGADPWGFADTNGVPKSELASTYDGALSPPAGGGGAALRMGRGRALSTRR